MKRSPPYSGHMEKVATQKSHCWRLRGTPQTSHSLTRRPLITWGPPASVRPLSIPQARAPPHNKTAWKVRPLAPVTAICIVNLRPLQLGPTGDTLPAVQCRSPATPLWGIRFGHTEDNNYVYQGYNLCLLLYTNYWTIKSSHLYFILFLFFHNKLIDYLYCND